MKIAIVSQYFDPEPVPIPGILARELAERGHQVSVVTAHPSYPDGRAAYADVVGSPSPGRVKVQRVWTRVSGSRGALARLLGYVSFGLSSMTTWRGHRPDVVYVYATQMTAAIGPSLWRRVHRTPYVLHVQDLWPESITGSGLVPAGFTSRLITAVLRPWLRSIYRGAAATVAISPGMRDLLVQRGASPTTTHSVLNWATDERPVDRPLSQAGSLNLMYGGNVGEMQDLAVAVEACALLLDLPGFTFTIVGSGAAEGRLRALARERGATNVVFHGRVPFDDMRDLYAASDFQLVSLIDLPIFRVTIPSKLQASLAAGIPIINTVPGDAGQIVEQEGVGIQVAAGDPQRLAEAIRTAYALSSDERRIMAERASAFYSRAMSQKSGIDRIEHILSSASTSGRNGTP